ncbi:DUF2189 domain-containing protein [Bauldia sp.]|uniref:DUF2189 domain-containing protein n=1 Tax=Bauldia sp. TaxID=2575872 RepID=UPI003BAA981F
MSETTTYQPPKIPKTRVVTAADIRGALRDGWSDFTHAPLYGLFFGAIYTVGGLLILAFLAVFDMPWMIIPIAVGFPLIGPFVAVGLYEVSRRRAAGEPITWKAVLLVIFQQRNRQLGWMAFIVLFIFWVWIYQVRLLLAIFLGFQSFASIGGFIEVITTTVDGLTFLAVGTIIGAFLAFVLYATTVITMPLLLERDIDLVSAMIVGFRAISQSPAVMIGWAVIITVLTILALVPAFLGLLVVLPVLGHATWHLYARIVEPNT